MTIYRWYRGAPTPLGAVHVLAGDRRCQSPQPMGYTSNDVAKATPIRCPVCRPKPSRNSAWVPVLPAEPFDVRRVGGERGHARVEGVGGVDRHARASGDPPTQTARTPPHGSTPSTSWSWKTQRLPASRTASRTACPAAMWSAWLRLRPPKVSWKLPVITISGRCRRMTAVISRRSGHAVLQDPVGLVQELDGVDPDDPGRLDLLGLAHRAGTRRAPGRRCRPLRRSPCSRRPTCPGPSSGRRPPRCRTPCRRDARRRRARVVQSSGRVSSGGGRSMSRACRQFG